MSHSKINFMTIPVNALTMQQTVDIIGKSIQDGKSLNHVVINAGKVVAMQTNKELYNSVVNCDIINADGQSIVWAANYLGQPLPERVAGIDLMLNLVEYAHQNDLKCFFFGAKEEVVSQVVKTFSEQYSPNLIVGYRNGYYTTEEEKDIAQQIANSNANFLFVAITSPKKEIFLDKYKEILAPIGFTMGVGGSFDVVAGITKRAPKWMQNVGLEWFYRLIQEPRRMWRRYIIGNYKFVKIVRKYKQQNKKQQ